MFPTIILFIRIRPATNDISLHESSKFKYFKQQITPIKSLKRKVNWFKLYELPNSTFKAEAPYVNMHSH
jgi:hypothetical protein